MRAASRLSPQLIGRLGGLLAVVSWGGYLALARAGVNQGLHPTDFLLMRFGPAALVLLPLLLFRWPAFRALGLVRAVTLTVVVGPLFVLLGVGGYKFAPLAHGAVIQPVTVTVASLLAATVLLREPMTGRRLSGVMLAVVGIALVGFGGRGAAAGSGPTWVGDLLFISAGLLWASFTILLRRWRLDPLIATAAVSILGAAIVVPAFLAFDTASRLAALPPLLLVAQVLVQGVLSGVIALIAFGVAVRNLGAGSAALFPALVPVAATLIGVPLTGEVPAPLQTLGLVIATAGLIGAMLSQTQDATVPGTRAPPLPGTTRPPD